MLFWRVGGLPTGGPSNLTHDRINIICWGTPLSGPIPPRDTERRNTRSGEIDTLDRDDLVDLLLEEDRLVPAAVAAARDELVAGLRMVEEAFRSGGRLFYVGAGTSGRLGVLDASECPPTYGTDPELVQGIIAGGQAALTNAVEGAEDDPGAGADALRSRAVGSADVVVGIAASGSTPFVIGALGEAQAIGASSILVTCARVDESVRSVTDLVIHADVGPEIVTGSTRLKAGTATKLILNILTTGSLVRLGKTYGNLMVDLQARNAKLHDRGERILMEVLGIERGDARRAIEGADGSVRTAIVMTRLSLTLEEAEQRLADADGRLRGLIGDPPRSDS